MLSKKLSLNDRAADAVHTAAIAAVNEDRDAMNVYYAHVAAKVPMHAPDLTPFEAAMRTKLDAVNVAVDAWREPAAAWRVPSLREAEHKLLMRAVGISFALLFGLVFLGGLLPLPDVALQWFTGAVVVAVFTVSPALVVAKRERMKESLLGFAPGTPAGWRKLFGPAGVWLTPSPARRTPEGAAKFAFLTAMYDAAEADAPWRRAATRAEKLDALTADEAAAARATLEARHAAFVDAATRTVARLRADSTWVMRTVTAGHRMANVARRVNYVMTGTLALAAGTVLAMRRSGQTVETMFLVVVVLVMGVFLLGAVAQRATRAHAEALAREETPSPA